MGSLEAAALPVFAPVSKPFAGVFKEMVANFLTALAEDFPLFLENPLNPSAFIVFSRAIIDFFVGHWTHLPIKTFWPVSITWLSMVVDAGYCPPPTP